MGMGVVRAFEASYGDRTVIHYRTKSAHKYIIALRIYPTNPIFKRFITNFKPGYLPLSPTSISAAAKVTTVELPNGVCFGAAAS